MISGISVRQGLHHVAQKLTNTAFPLNCDRLASSPTSCFRVKSGAGWPCCGGPWDESGAARAAESVNQTAVAKRRGTRVVFNAYPWRGRPTRPCHPRSCLRAGVWSTQTSRGKTSILIMSSQVKERGTFSADIRQNTSPDRVSQNLFLVLTDPQGI